MNKESKTCQNCKQNFVIEPEDFTFYEKISVPPPTWCPECRMQRRFAWRNEHILYRRKCDATGKEIFTMFSPQTPVKVYDNKYWWGDDWDASAFAQDYDFSRPFFEQLQGLTCTVPWFAQSVNDMVNSDYCMNAGGLKDCYLVFDANFDENCYYSIGVNYSKDCFNCYEINGCELCHECLFCVKCHSAFYSIDCERSHNIWFSKNLNNCIDCFGCVNLRNKQYYIFNKPYSKEAYQEKIKELTSGSYAQYEEWKTKAAEFFLLFPVKYAHAKKNFNSSGDFVYNSKNVQHSFHINGCENVKYSQFLRTKPGAKDCYDYTIWGENVELAYESYAVGQGASNIRFSLMMYPNCRDAEYSFLCPSSQDVFGCMGLKKKQYCILNKQYGKNEYEKLVLKIKEQMNTMPYMDKKGRVYKYGEFFPPELSPFAYNETTAQEYFPLAKEDAIEKGYNWKEKEERNFQFSMINTQSLPDNIKEVTDDIIKQVISCAHEDPPAGGCEEQCTEAFRIIPQELKFYRQMNIPLPRLCPNCRHYQRVKQRNPLKLWHRKCMCNGTNESYQNTAAHSHGEKPCTNEFETTYSPERKETVYCEKCYLAEVA